MDTLPLDEVNIDEMNVLLDGLDALEEADKKDLALSSMMKGMVGLTTSSEDIAEDFDKLKETRRPKTEAITLLKAKLIVLRDRKEIEALSIDDLVD